MMIKEDQMWENKVADFQAAPANGIRCHTIVRKTKYIRQDNNLLALFNNIQKRDPIEYLRACSYHLQHH
jgi:hypothetical protein